MSESMEETPNQITLDLDGGEYGEFVMCGACLGHGISPCGDTQETCYYCSGWGTLFRPWHPVGQHCTDPAKQAQEHDAFDPSESNLVKHAERELALITESAPGEGDAFDQYVDMIHGAVRQLITLFASQGHSGMSASITVAMFSKLAQFETLSENDHSIYVDQSDISFTADEIAAGKSMWQCSRDGRFFSDDKGATWYNIDDNLGHVR